MGMREYARSDGEMKHYPGGAICPVIEGIRAMITLLIISLVIYLVRRSRRKRTDKKADETLPEPTHAVTDESA